MQLMIDMACMESEQWTLTQFNAQNGAALQTLIDKHHVNLAQFPEKVMEALRKLSEEVVAEITVLYVLEELSSNALGLVVRQRPLICRGQEPLSVSAHHRNTIDHI